MCKIGAIILAAGSSERMGRPKLLLPFKGKPLLEYPLQLALHNKLHPIVLVSGCYHEQIQSIITPYQKDINLVYNYQYKSGMASSLKLGIRTLKEKVNAALIFLGDQPLVPKEAVKIIIEEYRKGKNDGIKIVRPMYGRQFGHPILFDASLFHQFNLIQGDEGGKSIVERFKPFLKVLRFQAEEWGLDIDTEKQYETLLKRIEENEYT